MNNNYYFTPWETKFLDSISHVTDTLVLVAPFIKLTTIKKIISALPKNKKIKLILISRFSKQVFTQKSSDLSLFDYLINSHIENLECYCYKLNKLHSKIYIIDNETMYITSSNLSYSGLIKNHEVAVEINNIKDIEYIKNEIFDLATPKSLIQNNDIIQMENDLQILNYNLLKTAKEVYHPAEDIIDDDITIEEEIIESITSTIVEKDLNISTQLEYNKLLEEINEYKSQRNILDISTLDNQQFKTVSLGNIEITEQINKNAKEDFNRLTSYLQTTFSTIASIDNNELLLSDLTSCFIHSTWHHRFKYIHNDFSQERKPFFLRIGKAAFLSILALSITKKRLFKQGSTQSFNDVYKYIKLNYPFSEALQNVKCNVYFYDAHIEKSYAENIFYELLGVFYWHLGFEKVQYIFNNYFNYIDEYIYDDYKSFEFKTLLQEITQQKFGLPEYIEISSTGQDHRKVFEFRVNLNGVTLGRGKGVSKKYAQENAAQEAIRVFINKHGYEEKIEQDLKLQTYELNDDRKKLLNELNNNILFNKVQNLALLDVAFTHISWVHKNRYSRANDSLSFLGSILENLCRTVGIIKSFDKLDNSTNKEYINIEQNIKVSTVFENYFDRNSFDKYINTYIKSKELPTSVKGGVVQAFISVHFLEFGLPDTIKLVTKIWDNFKTSKVQEGYVTRLQTHLQSEKFSLNTEEIKYVLISESGPDNKKIFKIGCDIQGKLYGIGEGRSKKESRRIAAKNTLENEEFKSNYPL